VVAVDVVRKNYYKLIIKEEHAVNLARAERFQHQSEEVNLLYDENGSAKDGKKYCGYVYLLMIA
jgi:hypothetical protein